MKNCAERLSAKKWGVFNHYLFSNICDVNDSRNLDKNIEDWDKAVSLFDVEKLAYNLHKMNAGYYFITLMQGTKHLLAPNAAYDKIAGTMPGQACAKRDLPMELAEALSKYDIDLCLYYTGDGPHADRAIGAKFGYNGDAGDGSKVDLDFCKNWASVLEEYAVRYGDKVKAWWIDGCYRDTLGYTDEYMSVYYQAIKKGNPNAAVSFNGGVASTLVKNYEHEDFTCGEFNDFIHIPESKYVDGALGHILAPYGYEPNGEFWWTWAGWGASGIKHPPKYMSDYVRKLSSIGVPVTIDIRVNIDGSFDAQQQAALEWMGNNI